MTPESGAHPVYLVDGTSQLFRAYFAIRGLTNREGQATNAVYGFTSMLRKLLQDEQPRTIAVIFDPAGPVFRHETYADYKANRPPVPDDLRAQVPLTKEVCRALGIPVIEQAGFEADDVIATFVARAVASGRQAVVVASDKDLLQLVSPGVTVLNPIRYERLDADAVERSFGTRPELVVDTLGLTGDSVDNIPGVPGVGGKTAVAVVSTYGDLEAIIDRARRFVEAYDARDGVLQALDALAAAEDAGDEAERLDRALEICRGKLASLAGVERDEAMRERFEAAAGVAGEALGRPQAERAGVAGRRAARGLAGLKKMMKGLDRGSSRRSWYAIAEHAEQARLSKRLATLESAVPLERDLDSLRRETPDAERVRELFDRLDFRALDVGEFAGPGQAGPAGPVRAATISGEYVLAATAEEATRAVVACREAGRAALAMALGPDLHPLRVEIAGVALSPAEGLAAYLPLERPAVPEARAALAGLLADPQVAKSVHDLKTAEHGLRRAGLPVAGWDMDTRVAAFVADATVGEYALDAVAEAWLGRPRPEAPPSRRGREAAEPAFPEDPLSVAERLGESADVVGRLVGRLAETLRQQELERVYRTIDGPLLPVLARMEARGVRVDVELLRRMSGEMAQRLERLRAEIWELAGERFNVESPKQLREVLFGRLGLASRRKTAKSREASTDAQTLEELAGDHPIVRKILDYRELAKLKGTYVDTLPELVDPGTGRVHTRFHPTGAATGRLSSSDPNLQNIPVRTEGGRKIREAFLPREGWAFLAADYSQVELRVLAHLSGDPGLLEAFRSGEDVHRHTAARVAGVPAELVTDAMRRQAKAVNFGILYGMSETRLARDQGMTRQQARRFISAYFERFGRVREYIDATRDQARRDAAVRTLFGRLRRFPQLRQRINRAGQEAALRAAVNTTIQGTAADLMKLAMLAVEQALERQGLQAQMLLQVHDELLLEVPRDQLETTGEVVRRAMEGVHPLSAPLVVDQKIGANWSEAT